MKKVAISAVLLLVLAVPATADVSEQAAPDACTPDAATLCLNNGRFQARAIFSAPSLNISNAPAQAVALTGDTGYFWFFSANNVEIVLKVVDGRAFNGFYWAFYGALSDVLYTITITDTVTNAVKTYTNPAGTLASVADVTAFSGSTTCSYTVSAPNPASFGSGGGTGTVGVTTAPGCTWSATSSSSFITVTSGASGSGNGTVSFSVAANGSASARTGTLTVAGQTVTIQQSGGGSGGPYDGSWSGTTSQGKAIAFTIANNVLTAFSIRYVASGSCGTVEGPFTFTTPGISGNGFTVATEGSISFVVTVNGTFNSSTSASGTLSVALTPPTTACNMSGSGTWTATKQSSLLVDAGARIETWAVGPSPFSGLAVEGGCTANTTTLCLNNGRFQARAIFSAPSLNISNAPAQAVALTGDTGYFWFFSANNVEIVLKVVDGRAFNGFYWAFYGALSDVLYTITITDTVTNAVKTYTNPAGTLASVADVTAFSGTAGCSFTIGAPSPSSFGAGGGSGSVAVTTSPGCSFTAASNTSALTITSGASYSGSSTVTFQVLANSSTSSRTLSMTIAGQTVTIQQFGQSTGGIYDGAWTGSTNQTCQPSSGAIPCPVNWTISNNNLLRFEIRYSGTACGVIDGGTTVTYTAPGRPISGNSFNITTTGGAPVRADVNVTVTKSSAFAATGTGSVTLTTSAPLPACTTTTPVTFTATKS